MMTSQEPLCRACGHREVLHGSAAHDCWCIAWDGARFCGCTVRTAAQQLLQMGREREARTRRMAYRPPLERDAS